jgi:putative tricarboxylic transport membrane protein
MKRCDQAYALVWILLGTFICVESTAIKLWVPDGPGSGLMPFLAGLTIGICGLLLFPFRSGAAAGAGETYWKHPRAWRRILFVLAGFCAMALLMPVLGFFPSSLLIMFFLVLVVERQNLFQTFLISLLTCMVLYALFQHVFSINLPRGVLPF